MYRLRTVSPGFSPISRAVTQPQRAIHSVIAENMVYPVLSSITLMNKGFPPNPASDAPADVYDFCQTKCHNGRGLDVLRPGVKDDPFDLNGPSEAGFQMIMDPWKDVYSSINTYVDTSTYFSERFLPIGTIV